MFKADYNLAAAIPADYNPRDIKPAALAQLRASIKRLGLVKAIIVSDEGRLIAGHQRLKAATAAGIKIGAAHVLADVSMEEEIRFNQLHNAGDVDAADARLFIPPTMPGWAVIPASRLRVDQRPAMASKMVEVQRLLMKFGPWGNAVATESGEIVSSQLYAFACKTLGLPLHVCVIPNRSKGNAIKFLGQAYGEFSYARLARTTWAQSLAQMFRLRGGRHARGQSRTYERVIIPSIDRSMRILDFGAGQMDYVKLLRREGYNILGVEFYRRKPGVMAIDLPAVHRDIDAVCRSLHTHGLFDAVVCDSVLNSVDSPQAQRDVLTTITALCKPGGLLVFSGRRRAFEDRIEHGLNKSRSMLKRHVYFLDNRGFSAMYQRGVWMFQRFHTDAEIAALARRYAIDARLRIEGSGWSVAGKPRVPEDPEPSLAREFNLPLPGGASINRGDQIVAAWRSASENQRAPSAEKGARARLAVPHSFTESSFKGARQSKPRVVRRSRSNQRAPNAAAT